jgi:hypothetical protein
MCARVPQLGSIVARDTETAAKLTWYARVVVLASLEWYRSIAIARWLNEMNAAQHNQRPFLLLLLLSIVVAVAWCCAVVGSCCSSRRCCGVAHMCFVPSCPNNHHYLCFHKACTYHCRRFSAKCGIACALAMHKCDMDSTPSCLTAEETAAFEQLYRAYAEVQDDEANASSAPTSNSNTTDNTNTNQDHGGCIASAGVDTPTRQCDEADAAAAAAAAQTPNALSSSFSYSPTSSCGLLRREPTPSTRIMTLLNRAPSTSASVSHSTTSLGMIAGTAGGSTHQLSHLSSIDDLDPDTIDPRTVAMMELFAQATVNTTPSLVQTPDTSTSTSTSTSNRNKLAQNAATSRFFEPISLPERLYTPCLALDQIWSKETVDFVINQLSSMQQSAKHDRILSDCETYMRLLTLFHPTMSDQDSAALLASLAQLQSRIKIRILRLTYKKEAIEAARMRLLNQQVAPDSIKLLGRNDMLSSPTKPKKDSMRAKPMGAPSRSMSKSASYASKSPSSGGAMYTTTSPSDMVWSRHLNKFIPKNTCFLCASPDHRPLACPTKRK